MNVLFVGGTGLISSACTDAAVEAGHDVWILNRGTTGNVAIRPEVRSMHADVRDEEAVRAAVRGLALDVVVDFLAFTVEDVERDLRVFPELEQFVFVSSASAYEKPPSNWLITESTPLANPFWQYSRDKIACEQRLAVARSETGCPVTVVRPSLTYGPSQIPVCVGSWAHPYTIVERMRAGKPVIVPGDGTAIWTVTHNRDFARAFVPLIGNAAAIGESLHITSDEALTWNRIYSDVADAAGVEVRFVHVPTDALIAADPDLEGTLWGDKVHSTVFDNSKLKRLVPGFAAEIPFRDGIRETVAWFDADERRRTVDAAAGEQWDRIVAVYEEALRRVAW